MSFVERTCSCCGGENPEKTRIDAILAKYEGVKGALIPILQEVQSLYNYLPKDALEYVAAQTGTPIAQIYGVVTFIRSSILIRAGAILSAYARALPATYAAAKPFCRRWKKELDIKAGHTTDDLRFTLETVACIGACGLAPVMQVNEDTHGRLTPDKLKAILAKYQ